MAGQGDQSASAEQRTQRPSRGWGLLGVTLLLLPVIALLFYSPPAPIHTAGQPARMLRAISGKLDVTACERSTFRVAIDVGHTAEAPGAMSARGIPEYDFNLRLAGDVEHSLLGAGFAKSIVLVTAGRSKPSLYERVARANALPADLFISIHHDSVPGFLKEKWEYDGHENDYCDRFKGHSIFVSHENRKYRRSLKFASLLGQQLKAHGLGYTPHYTEAFMGHWQRKLVDADAGVYRYDQLHVLRTTRMPAVLLEAGSIVNRDEEEQLAAPERRQLIAAAVADAVEGFCDSYQPGAARRHIARRSHGMLR